jgi:hypothetical protein
MKVREDGLFVNLRALGGLRPAHFSCNLPSSDRSQWW